MFLPVYVGQLRREALGGTRCFNFFEHTRDLVRGDLPEGRSLSCDSQRRACRSGCSEQRLALRCSGLPGTAPPWGAVRCRDRLRVQALGQLEQYEACEWQPTRIIAARTQSISQPAHVSFRTERSPGAKDQLFQHGGTAARRARSAGRSCRQGRPCRVRVAQRDAEFAGVRVAGLDLQASQGRSRAWRRSTSAR